MWAGKAVNFAAKAAQVANQHELIVTGSVWDKIEGNDYLTMSCPCGGGPSTSIWHDKTIDKLPDDDADREGRLLTSAWCVVHGAEYCNAILEGSKSRAEVTDLRKSVLLSQMQTAIAKTARQKREASRARKLSGIR